MSESYKRLIDELEKKLKYTERLLYENALVSLLNGRMMSNAYEDNELANLKLNFDTDSYILLSIDVEAAKEDESPNCHIIDDILSGFLDEYGYVYHYLYHHGCMNYIIASEDMKMRNNVLKAVADTLKIAKEKYMFSFYTGVGGVYKTRSGISRSCRESRRALEYCLAEGIEMIEHDKVSGGATYNYFYSKSTEQHLINAVKINNKEKVSKELDRIFEECMVDGKLTLSIVRLVASNLFDTLGTIFSAAGYSGEKVFPEGYHFMRSVYQKNDADEIIRTIRSMYERCYEELYAEQTEKSVFMDRVIDFINKNFQNVHFGIQDVAEKFGLTKGYIARIFKDEAGISINDYIMMTRINKSKELLENTGELIDSIAVKAGFSSYRTFARNFKEMVGLLPKDYRKKEQRK